MLDRLFYPRSIAVVGASRTPGSVGHSLLANLIGNRYQGVVYPVNPHARGILGIKSYPSLRDIPDDVDLAIVVVPARSVAAVLEECGEKGVRNAVVISAGFKEVGGAGITLEKEVQSVARKHGILLVGPNCLGVINTDPSCSLNATFATEMPQEGNIGLISQSGALCVAVLDYAKESRIGFSKFISMGNKAGINENDLLRYLQDDPRTDVILMYLEDLVNGREFMRIAWEITDSPSRPKPIIALKAGRTLLGAQAASSHTGSLAGPDKVYDAVFEQCGVLRVQTLEEMFDYVKAFSRQPLPRGRNVAIVTNSGGPGILATDSCIEHGLNIVPLNPDTASRLRANLPSVVSVQNPLDLVAEAQAEQYETALREVLGDRDIHSAIVILTATAYTRVEEIAEAVVRVFQKYRKPLLACLVGVFDVSRGIQILEAGGIPAYKFPESAARVLSELATFTDWLERPRTQVKTYPVDMPAARSIIEAARKDGRDSLYEHEAYEVLRAYGFPVIPFESVPGEEEAVQAFRRIGPPVVLKVVSPDILHKFDFGGVRLDLKTEEEVRKAARSILEAVRDHKPDARVRGLIVEKMASGGREVILGMNRDPQFGPILMFGLGGIYVEALEDVSFRLAPIRELSAQMMITQTKTHKILEGFRGGPVYDIEAIADCIKRLSQLVTDFDDIKELDLNPLIVYEKGKGCAIVDARVILG